MEYEIISKNGKRKGNKLCFHMAQFYLEDDSFSVDSYS